MNPNEIREQFADACFGIEQISPYPVAAPTTLEALTTLMRFCSEFGLRILPLGSGSSFPSNFTLRTERTFALALSRMREVNRLENDRLFCQAGVPVSAVLLTEFESDRQTLGGLLCGTGGAGTRQIAREVWQLTRHIVVADSRGRLHTYAGPSSPAFLLSHAASILLESRGKAGILVGLELEASALPIKLGDRSLCTSFEGRAAPALTRQPTVRALDAASVFDW